MQRFDQTAFTRGRGKSRYPSFDSPPPEQDEVQPWQRNVYPTGVKPGSETIAAPMPPPAQDPMAEFQKLGSPPRREQVERGRQGKYAPFVQALSGLGDVYAAKAGQRGNYLDRTIGLQQGMIDQDYGDRLRNAGANYEGDTAAYNQRVQGMNLAHQIGRETVADKAREWTQNQTTAGTAESKRRYDLDLGLRTNADTRAAAESAALLKQMAAMGSSDAATLDQAYDIQLGVGVSPEQGVKDIMSDNSIPIGERVKRAKEFQIAVTRKASGDEKLRGGAYMFGQPDFSLGEWGTLTSQFRATQDPEQRRALLNRMDKINPSVPFIGDRYSQLPDDIKKWAQANW